MVRGEKVSLKIIVLGDSGVGKTALLKRYIKKRFYDDYNATIGVNFMTKQIVVDTYLVTLQIWDTSGQRCFRSVAISFSEKVDGCILVFDVTSTDTLESLDSWYKEFLEQTKPENPEQFPIVILGNKIDLNNRSVSEDEARQWCESQHNLPYYEISAKKNVNIKIAFETLAKNALAQRKNVNMEL